MTQDGERPQLTRLTGHILRAHGFDKELWESFEVAFGSEGRAINHDLIKVLLSSSSQKVDQLALLLLDRQTYYDKFEAQNKRLEVEYRDQLKAVPGKPLRTFIWQQSLLVSLAFFPALGAVGLAGMLWPTASLYGFWAVLIAVVCWIAFVARLGPRLFPDRSVAERAKVLGVYRKSQRELLLQIWDAEHPVLV